MTLTHAQKLVLDHLKSSYVGPEGGAAEVIQNPPNRQYAVGMLFPRDAAPDCDAGAGEPESDEADVEGMTAFEGEVEENAAAVPIAEDWRPSSAAISFITDGKAVFCDVAGATYSAVESDGPPSWRRAPFAITGLELTPNQCVHEQTAGDVPIEIGSRWRTLGDDYLVTVHLRVLATSSGDNRLDATNMLYQVALAVSPNEAGTIREYDTRRQFDLDNESAELRLRFRNRKVFAVGHGMAADWTMSHGACTQIRLEPVPHFVVPDVETTGVMDSTLEGDALRLDHLATLDTNTDQVLASLNAFIQAFGKWVREQIDRMAEFGPDRAVAERIVDRSKVALERMTQSVELLRSEGNSKFRTAFSLGIAAMRLQMRQASINRDGSTPEPRWRPFQLGFLLVALASTLDDTHDERELVDLIWFPTGGGKTEAYLGLAAIEIFRRRLSDGPAGGGTAVLTRYTLRLNTVQLGLHQCSLAVCPVLVGESPSRTVGCRTWSRWVC